VTLVRWTNYHGSVPSSAAPTIDLAGLAAQLRLSVFRLSRKLRRQLESPITQTQLAALSTIERHGPLTAGELATHEQIQKPTCTAVIAALMDLDLIERTPDPLDGRVAWLQITPAGRRVLQQVRKRHTAYLARRMRRLSPDEIDTLERATHILERLTEEDER
jgi:DNA-binding MarR family transcriptional regulator